MQEITENVWHRREKGWLGPGLQHIFVFVALTVVGTLVGTLGTVSLPVGLNISAFWPAMTLQVVGGMWFGAWGVLGGVVFALFSNLFTGGTMANILGFIPANIVQSGLTLWVFRHYRLTPWLPSTKDVAAFILAGVLLSSILGALLGVASLVLAGEVDNPKQIGMLISSWVIGNGLPCLLLGIPLLKYFSPLVVKSPFFCNDWFGGRRSFRWPGGRLQDWPVAARLLLGFGVAAVLPVLAISSFCALFQTSPTGAVSCLVLPIMLNLSIFLSMIVSGLIAQPISLQVGYLAEGARRLGKGELSHRIPAAGKDELAQLATSFNKMAVDLEQYMQKLAETTAAKERIESELKIAHDIQMGILHKIFPPFPEIRELEIFATLKPAKEVGGDFYDFYFIDNDHICFAVGDVSGKGVPAALFMAVSKTLLKMNANRGLSAAQLLSRVNQDLSQENPSLMFVTILLGILNIRSGELEYCNGGHLPAFRLPTDGAVMELEMPAGIALGVMEDYVYQSKKIVLEQGEAILLYTDGVTEAMNHEEELFSDERLKLSLSRLREKGLDELVHGVKSEIESFSKGTAQSDDITMLALRYFG